MPTSPRLVYGLINPMGNPVMNPVTGQRVLRKAPFGFVNTGYIPTEAVMYSAGWEEYTGNLSALTNACGTVTPPSGSPTWTLSSLPGAIAGQYYSQSFVISSVGTPSSGRTLTGVIADSKPAWLDLVVIPSDNSFALRGTVPLGITTFSVTLILQQTVGGQTPKTFTVSVSSVSVYAYVVYTASSRIADLYIGTDGSGTPTAQILYSPASFTDHTVYAVGRMGTPGVLGTPNQNYFFNGAWGNLQTGSYVWKIVWLGQTVYATLDIIAGQSSEGVLSLSTTAPAAPTTGNPVRDGDTEDIVNHAPTVVTPTGFLTCYYGQGFSYQFPADMFADSDGDALTWGMEYSPDGGSTYQALPSWCSFNSATRTWSGTSTQTVNRYFRKVVSDGNGGVAYDPFFLITIPTN